MARYKGQYRVIKKGRKWIQVLSVPQNWKAELLLDEATQSMNVNEVITGIFEILKDFPRQIKWLPQVPEHEVEDEKNLSEFNRWLGYCEDAIKRKETYPNGIQKAEFFLNQLKTVDKVPLQHKLDEVKARMKTIQTERQRQNDLDKFKRYVGFVKNHEGYYANGFAVLDEIVSKWGLDEYKQEVKILKQEALKRDLFLQIERARTIERIDEIMQQLNQDKVNGDVLDRARKKKAEIIKRELERNFEQFKQNYVYDLELKQWLLNFPGIVSDVEDLFSDEDTQYISNLIDQFAAVYESYVKLPKPSTDHMPDVIREKLKEICRAKFEPLKADWYVPIDQYHDAEALLAKKAISMDDIYQIAKDQVNPEAALNFEEMIAKLPGHYNWLKRQYVMVIHPGDVREYIGKRINFTSTRKNAEIEYSDGDKRAIQTARFLQYRDGSHKHLKTFLYIQVDGKWYLLIATEDHLWNELLIRYIV